MPCVSHGSATQALNATLDADATRLALDADKKAEAKENLHELRTLARQAMAHMCSRRRFGYIPLILKEEGFVAALERAWKLFEAGVGLQIDLQVEGRTVCSIAIEDESTKIAQGSLK